MQVESDTIAQDRGEQCRKRSAGEASRCDRPQRRAGDSLFRQIHADEHTNQARRERAQECSGVEDASFEHSKNLKTLQWKGADDYLVLLEACLERLAVFGPPALVQNVSHDFVHDDVIAFRLPGASFPEPTCGCSSVGGHSTEALRKLARHTVEKVA
jgi:hypothetical protein